jgi:hypothetical protein
MAQLFRPHADTVARLVLIGILALPVLAWAGVHAMTGSPYATGQSAIPDQPVPFSHEHHVGEMGVDCRFCHASVETSRYGGAPALHACMTCHAQIWRNAPVLAPIRDAAARNAPFAWTRVNRLPDFVYFDHSVHVRHGIGCGECHGDVARQPLTMQAAPLTMAWCLDCHRAPGPRLRPQAEITDTRPRAPNSPQQSSYLLKLYHIDTSTLTECSTCHR